MITQIPQAVTSTAAPCQSPLLYFALALSNLTGGSRERAFTWQCDLIRERTQIKKKKDFFFLGELIFIYSAGLVESTRANMRPPAKWQPHFASYYDHFFLSVDLRKFSKTFSVIIITWHTTVIQKEVEACSLQRNYGIP